MTTQNPTGNDRRIPLYIADYIAQRGKPVERAQCSGCLEHMAIAGDGVNDYCQVCWAGMHGYDQAEEKTARALIEGALNGALEAGVDMDVVRQIVETWLAQGGE